jgi:hypothetical protein
MRPVSVYSDLGNTVIVQGVSGGMEFGKYVVPLTSSHLPPEKASPEWIEGGFILAPATGLLSWLPPGGEDSLKLAPPAGPTLIDIGGGELAKVYDYKKSQPGGAANRSQPIRSETNPAPAAAGSGR